MFVSLILNNNLKFTKLLKDFSLRFEEINKVILVLSVASLFVAGSGFAATSTTTKHHPRGYHAYATSGSGHGYRSTCARFNARLANEPGAIAIQDQDQAQAVGGRRGTCH